MKEFQINAIAEMRALSYTALALSVEGTSPESARKYFELAARQYDMAGNYRRAGSLRTYISQMKN